MCPRPRFHLRVGSTLALLGDNRTGHGGWRDRGVTLLLDGQGSQGRRLASSGAVARVTVVPCSSAPCVRPAPHTSFPSPVLATFTNEPPGGTHRSGGPSPAWPGCWGPFLAASFGKGWLLPSEKAAELLGLSFLASRPSLQRAVMVTAVPSSVSHLLECGLSGRPTPLCGRASGDGCAPCPAGTDGREGTSHSWSSGGDQIHCRDLLAVLLTRVR